MRSLLLLLHILGAAAWFGGGLFASVSFASLARSLGVRPVMNLDQAIGAKFFGAAVGTVALTGVALVLMSPTIGWGTAFVLVGIAVVVLDGFIEGAVLGPRLKRLAASPDASVAAFRRESLIGTLIHVVLLVTAFWAMVVRLGL